MADLETLTLQITAESQKALTAIDKLANRLNNLSVVVGSLETSKLNQLSFGLSNLNAVIEHMKGATRASDYTRIVKELGALGTVDTNKLYGLANCLAVLSMGFSNLASVTYVTDNIQKLISALGKFGNKSAQSAITNIPKLESALAHLITTISNLPEVKQSIIDFTNSLANLAAQGSSVGSAANSIDSSLGKFETAATRSTKKAKSLASAIGKMYAEFWLAMRAAKGLKNAFVSTADYLEAYNYFDVTATKIGTDSFRRAGEGSAETYAEAFTSTLQEKLKKMSGLELDVEQRLIKTTNAKSLGLNLTELTQYQASVASITNAMGVSQEIAQSTAKAFSMLAGDMSSLKNLDFEQVAQNLQSGLSGMARSLYKYGIDITSASLEQYAFANGITKSVSEMSQAEKAQLRLIAILDQSKVAWGDLAHTINSPSNQLRQLKTNLKEVGTVLGQLFIPWISRTLPYINGLSIAIKRLLVDIASMLGIQLNLDEFGTGFADTFEEDTEAVDNLNKAMKETKKGIREFDELKVIGGDNSKAGAGLSDQIDLTKQILDATAEYERVWDEAYKRMTSKAQEISEYISLALEPIKNIIGDFAIGDFFKAGEDISGLVISITKFISNAIRKVDWELVGTKIGDFFRGIKWNEVFEGIGEVISVGIQAALDLWHGIFNAAPFETAIIAGFAALKYTGLGQILQTTISKSIAGKLTEAGITKEILKKIGVGVVTLGIGVALMIDNITEIKAGKYSASSVQSIVKSLVSSAMSGAGISLIAGSLGIASGGVAFAVGAAISLVVNLLIGKAVEPPPLADAERIVEEEYAWVDEHGLNTLEIITNLKVTKGNVDVEFGTIEELARKVYDLSLSYNDLTDGEKGLLKYYSDELIEVMPELASQIDKVTGAYKGSKEELEKLLELQKEQMYINAYKENLSAITSEKANVEKDIYDLNEKKKQAEEELEALRQMYIDTAVRYGHTEAYGNAWFDDIVEKLLAGEDAADVAKIWDKRNEKWSEFDVTGIAQRLAVVNVLEPKIEKRQKDLDKLNEEFEYWQEQYKGTWKKMNETEEQAMTLSEEIITSGKLPNAMKSAMGNVAKEIENGEKVSKADMNSMFSSINNSFAGLGDGKVPEEVQDTMTNIEAAILTNSPKLINYMAQLRIQMEKAFADAHYNSNGDLIWNPNNVIGNIDNIFARVESAIGHFAPTKGLTKDLADSVKQVFGEELPESVQNAMDEVINLVDSNANASAIRSAISKFENVMVIEADKMGHDIAFGVCGGVTDAYGNVYDAFYGMGEVGYQAYDAYNQFGSPSKLYRKIAKFIPEGAALGIEDGIPDLELAAEDMSESVKSIFSGYEYNIPTLDTGTPNGNSFNYGNMDSQNAFMSQIASAVNQAQANGQTEIVLRIEGDPHGMFTVMMEEDSKYKKQTHGRSAFA